MPTSCRFIDQVIECTYEGMVSPDELFQVARQAVDLHATSRVDRFLADLTRLGGGHSPSDLLGVVDLLESSGLPRTLREAMVVSPSTASAMDVQFYEDACRNRGWNVRIFVDRAAALEWLRAP